MFPLDMIPAEARRPWDSAESPNVVLVGNLPFNVATPFLIRLLKSMSDQSNIFSFGRVQCILTFQHEVAYRMAAIKDDPERCRLSAICQVCIIKSTSLSIHFKESLWFLELCKDRLSLHPAGWIICPTP